MLGDGISETQEDYDWEENQRDKRGENLVSIPKKELHRLIDKIPEQQLARAKRYLEMLAQNTPPRSATVPRPDNKPSYIDPNCPRCGSSLVLADPLEDPDLPSGRIWYDEFICPKCCSGIFLDLPEGEIAEIEAAKEEVSRGEWVDLDEFRKNCGL